MVTSGGGWGEGVARDLGVDMYTLLCLKWIANKDLLDSTGNSAQCYVVALFGEEENAFSYMICMAESLCCI